MAPISRPSHILCEWMEWNVYQAVPVKDSDGEVLYSLKVFTALGLLKEGS